MSNSRTPDQTNGRQKRSASGTGDFFFRWLTALAAFLTLFVVFGIALELVRQSHLAARKFGLGFLTSNAWDPVKQNFGAASSIFGTLISTLIAMLLAVPFALIIALFLVEIAHPLLGRVVGTAIELLAAIPSIIYGMWGLFVFAPFLQRHVQPVFGKYLGFLPVFSGPPMGIGMLTAGIILALMILPFICAVTRDVFALVPSVVKEAGYGVGATTWEVTRDVTLKYGMQGVIGAGFLGLGRAVGETMAVTFVIGNNHSISASLFASGNTIASTLANEFAEATEPIYLSSLMELGLVLFLLTFVIQVAAHLWLRRIERGMGKK